MLVGTIIAWRALSLTRRLSGQNYFYLYRFRTWRRDFDVRFGRSWRCSR